MIDILRVTCYYCSSFTFFLERFHTPQSASFKIIYQFFLFSYIELCPWEWTWIFTICVLGRNVHIPLIYKYILNFPHSVVKSCEAQKIAFQRGTTRDHLLLQYFEKSMKFLYSFFIIFSMEQLVWVATNTEFSWPHYPLKPKLLNSLFSMQNIVGRVSLPLKGISCLQLEN